MSKKWLALAIIGGGSVLAILGLLISLFVKETATVIALLVLVVIAAGIGVYTIKALKPNEPSK